ncbi:MAG: hypothetical protein LUI06_08865 [Ruminococcus sp.]|nr:hypothetical protein [Ruminococcus sp.]
MSRTKAVILSTLCALVLASCTEAPDSVKEQNQSSNDTQSKNEAITNDDSEMGEYKQALNSLNLDNMSFSQNLIIDMPTEISGGEYIYPEDFDENYVELFSHYDSDYDEANVFEEEGYYPPGPSYTNNEKGLYFSIGTDGYFYYSKDYDTQKYINEATLIQAYSAGDALVCNDGYKLEASKDEITPSEACKLAQDFADDFVQTVSYPCEFEISRVSLYETEDGYFYNIEFAQRINDVAILEYYSAYDQSLYDLAWNSVTVDIYSDEVNSFCTTGYYVQQSSYDELQSPLDPVEASEYVSEHLASNMDLEVKRMSLEYCMHDQVGGTVDTTSYYTSQICWIFYFDETPGVEKFAMLNLDDMSVKFVDNTGA